MRRRSLVLLMTFSLVVSLVVSSCNALGQSQTGTPTPEPTTTVQPTATATVASPPTEAPTTAPTPTSVPPTATPAATEVDPVVVVAPTSGPPGTEITVQAGGFQPGTAVELGIGPVDSEYDVVATAQADETGSVETTVDLPDGAVDGQRWVVVATIVGQPVKATSNLFAVTSAAGAPTAVVTPRSGPPGTLVTVRGEGYTANTTLDIGFGRIESEYDVVKQAETDDQGSLTTELRVPEFAEPEDRWVFVIANPQTGAKGITSPFDVTSGMPIPTETPVAGGFTRANITLIAVDNGGDSGKLIGCNDSAVPVEVTFEPTIAPLRAALEELLAIESEYYGGSGLYNALHQSDLRVGGIDIVEGTATIELRGNLVIGGTCDAPRVEAQIKETALQFSTVDRVVVLINGQPLEDVLSAR